MLEINYNIQLMGEPHCPQWITPLVAMLSGDIALFQSAKKPLQELFGPIELESPLFPFAKTSYYEPTMGPFLQRQFYSFQLLADPVGLANWKLCSNAMEVKARQLQQHNSLERPINLDVGYITGAKLVLASTKDCVHRLYLKDGIYAEITMYFRRDRWVSHQFTFPDFKSGMYDVFLRKARDHHLRRVKLERMRDATLPL